jgi:hypothetical protein
MYKYSNARSGPDLELCQVSVYMLFHFVSRNVSLHKVELFFPPAFCSVSAFPPPVFPISFLVDFNCFTFLKKITMLMI